MQQQKQDVRIITFTYLFIDKYFEMQVNAL